MSVLPVKVIGDQFLPVLISTQELFVIFSLPHPAEESSDREIGGHLASSQGKFTTLRAVWETILEKGEML